MPEGGADLVEVELQIERLGERYSKPISEATTGRYGRKVLAYPVMLDKVGTKAYSLQCIPAKSKDDIKLWPLPTKEEGLQKRHTGYLENIEQL
jgi:hypothetical protein